MAGRSAWMRGAGHRARTQVVAPLGHPIEHVPVRNDRGQSRGVAAVLWVASAAWWYRAEITVTLTPLLVWVWLSRTLAGPWHAIVAVVLVIAVIAVDRRYRVVAGWVGRCRFRRRWDAACRHVWLADLDDRAPAVRNLTTPAVGERFTTVLPAGLCVDDLDYQTARLAAQLRAREVRIRPDRADAGQATVTVVHHDPLAMPVDQPWPLLDDHADVSVWDAVPIGVDEDGDPTLLPLPYRNVLVGGEPGAGKSVAVAQLVAAAALDPTTDLWLLDGKRVELGVWRDSAARFVDTDIQAATDMLVHLQSIIDVRLDWLDRQPAVRRKIAPADGQRVQVVVCDEYAYYTTRSDRKAVKAFEDAFTDLVARGRAVGVIVILATQKPHSSVIDTNLRDLFAFRWALRCTTPQASDTILGQGWAGLGYSAADLDPTCPGVGWLLAEGREPVRMRSHHLTDDDVDQLAQRAADIRRDGEGSALRLVQ